MSRPAFLPALLFAALAGAGALVWVSSVEAALGTNQAASVYALSLVPLYALWAAPSWGRGATAAALAASLSVPSVHFWPSPLVAAVTSICALSVARIAVLQRRFQLTAVAAEAIMGGAALGASAYVYDGTAFGCAMAVWVACLVEIAGAARSEAKSRRPTAQNSAFDAAREHILRILEAEEKPGSSGQ